jgi:hypothetical protein
VSDQLPMKCSLCGKPVRSVYALPGERTVKLCATCFFKPVPTTEADRAAS